MSISRIFKPSFALGAAFTLLLSASEPAQAAPVILKVTTQNAENALSTEVGLKPWLQMIEKDAQGTIKFELYANQTLSKGNQNWMAVKNGIADMAWNSMSMYNGMNPLMEVVTLPGLINDPMILVDRLWEIYTTIPAAQAMYKDVRLLCVYPSDSLDGLRLVKPATTLEDMKGRKLHSFGSAPAVAGTKGLGAVPIPMAMPDVYMALQKGTIDGCRADWDSFMAFHMHEVAKYSISNAPLGCSHFSIIINEKKFNSLPAVAQEAILKHSGYEGSRWHVEHFSNAGRALKPDALARGLVEMYTLPPEEEARWIEACKPAWDIWLNYAVDKGVSQEDARKALDIMTRP